MKGRSLVFSAEPAPEIFIFVEAYHIPLQSPMRKSIFSISFPLIITLLAVILSACNNPSPVNDTYVVMLSLDGFRWDYTDKFETPNFDRLADEGVKADALIPCFPSKTFPNHYSMVTGLYPDHHGIVQNSFFDPATNRIYSIGNRETVEDESFYEGEPIWVTAEKQGIRSASYFWVGSEAPSGGMYPSIWKKYDQGLPFESRIDSVISWLELPLGIRPRLVTFYMHEPDSKGHYLGPDNPELGKTIVYLDSLLGDLMEKLATLDISDQVNLIVTSDHGMCPVSPERYTDLADYIDTSWVSMMIGYNPNFLASANAGYYDSIISQLDMIPHVSAWPSEGVPDRLNYGSNIRTLDFVFVADSSWSVGWRQGPSEHASGGHGYDIANTDVHAIFYARGPAFKPGYSHPRFSNTDIYSLIAHLLDLTPEPTDGDLDNVRSMLRN
ncbi:MAG TPA: alkaline phosphatase family protein [Bacteroides sp.]|nr:alkaline phosphatase family protein [Bacteroides sp.]